MLQHGIDYIVCSVAPEDQQDLAACGLGCPFASYAMTGDLSCSTSSLCLDSSYSLQQHSVCITFSFWCVSFWDEHSTHVAVAQVIGTFRWPHHTQRALYHPSEDGMTHRDLTRTLAVIIQFILTRAISQRQCFD